MTLRGWLAGAREGYHTFHLPGLGEIHLEISRKSDAGDGSALWEGWIHCREGQYGPLCAVLHIIEEPWEELVRQLEVALPSLAKME